MAPIVIPPLITPVAKPLTMPRKHPVLLNTSCVAYYDFSRGPKLQDFSGKGNHGAITGATFVAKGKHGTALDFDFVDDYVDCGNNDVFNMTTKLTVEVWATLRSMPDEGAIYKPICSKGNGNREYTLLYQTNAREIQFLIYDTKERILGFTHEPDNLRHHIVATYDGATTNIYMDAELKNTAARTSIITTTTDNFFIGTDKDKTRLINAIIDMVRIYNKALTANEITRLYKAEQ